MSIDVTVSGTPGTTLTERIAEEIRAWLGRRDMSRAELARQLGVSKMWVSYRLNGAQPIDVNDLAAIARVLKVSVVMLIPEPDRSAIAPYLPLTEEPTSNPHRPPDNRPNGHPSAHRQPGIRRTARVQRPATRTGA